MIVFVLLLVLFDNCSFISDSLFFRNFNFVLVDVFVNRKDLEDYKDLLFCMILKFLMFLFCVLIFFLLMKILLLNFLLIVV